MVDRSYSPYESIRNYHDRGMMKWGAFATGELVEAQKKFTEEQNIEDSKMKDIVNLTMNSGNSIYCGAL